MIDYILYILEEKIIKIPSKREREKIKIVRYFKLWFQNYFILT